MLTRAGIIGRKLPANFALGVNLTGMQNQFPSPPSLAEMTYFVNKGIKNFRLPIGWSQNNSFYGVNVGIQQTTFAALDTTSTYLVAGGYVAALDTVLANAASLGAKILLDVHTFSGGPGGSVGSDAVPVSAFADLWGKISARYKGNPGVRGYDLMNEWPNGFDSAIVLAANQAAINAIRANGDTTKIYIEGTNYSGSWNWVSGQGQSFNNANLYQLVDPADNLIFSAHCYLDRDSSGTHFGWTAETADPGESPPGTPVSTSIGVTRLTPFVNWGLQHGVRMHLGEIGCSSDSLAGGGNDDYAHWNTAMDNVLAYCQANNVEVDLWGGGFAPTYPFCMEPSSVTNTNNTDYTAAGLQATQMVLLEKYSGYAGPQPTAYRIDLPLDGSLNPIRRGSSGVASNNFTIRYGGKISSAVTITPYAHFNDGTNAGGTFIPSNIILPAGDNAVATFTYTPSTSATFVIGTTNSAGWSDPPTLGFTTAIDSFAALSASPTNIFGLRRLLSTYIGPAIRLQRASDSTQMDFYFNNNGDLPRQAIQDWASSRTINILTIYDQSPNGNNLTYSGSNYAILTLTNSQGYPEVTWPAQAHMDFNSPNAGQTGQSVLARVYDTSGANPYFTRQDEYVGPFSFSPSGYSINSSPSASVSMNYQASVWHHYAATFKSNLTSGIIGYRDGSQVAAADTVAYTFVEAGGPGAQMGYFRFYAPAYWLGSWTEYVIINDAITPTQVAAFSTNQATYYSTPLPDSLSAINPLIAGTSARQCVVGKTMTPFTGVTVADGNSGPPTDSVTITLSGNSGGTLAGTGLSGTGPYTLSGTTASTITTQLQALTFTPVGAAGSSETFTIGLTSSAGTSASDNATVVSVVNIAPAETPYATPSGTFTPINYKGVNIAGAENQYPTTNKFNYLYPQNIELDYFASKGFGLIRMPITARRIQPASYGPLDPVSRTDEPTNGYVTYPAGSQTNLLEIKRVLDHAFTKNMYVIIDPHDYGSIKDTLNNNTSRAIGADSEGTAQFVDWWTRVATVFKNYPNVIWGLMNEPSASGQTAALWKTAATAAINAIAGVTTTQTVFIPGIFFTGAEHWTAAGNAAAWAGYTPPAGLSIVFEMHEYLDSDNSGTHSTVVAGKGATCLNSDSATTWARNNGFKIFLGECGWSGNDSQSSGGTPSVEGTAIMHYMTTNSDVWMGWSYWLGGSNLFYSSYGFTVVPTGYPTGPFTDTPQMSILTANI